MRKIELKSFGKLILLNAILSIFFIWIPIAINIGNINKVTILMLCAVILFWLLIFLGAWVVNKIYNIINTPKNDKTYYRDIPKNYTPAIASLIYNNTYEPSLDVPATLLSLVGKKVLFIDESLRFEVNQNQNLHILENHEQYLCDCIMEKCKFELDTFKRIVINDAIDKKLIVKNKANKNKAFIFFVGMIIIMMMIMIFSKNLVFPAPVGMILTSIAFVITFIGTAVLGIIDKNASKNEYVNTSFGNEERKKLVGLKNFLEEFSSLDEVEVKYVKLWDEYLAYAYMFGINNKIFNKFLNDKKYQKLFVTEYFPF